MNPSDASLLGSSVGNISSINNIFEEKTALLKKMGDRLVHLSSHDAILILKHSFAIPKLLYNLRTSPCFLSPALEVYDKTLRSIVSGITNIHFEEPHPAWLQATLPVKLGGLGVWSAVQLAPSAFLASAAASSDLVCHIVPPTLQSSPIPFVEKADRQWSVGDSVLLPEGTARCRQKVWDTIKAKILADALLDSARDSRRLLASRARESGVWLNVLPISSLGLRMASELLWASVWVPTYADLILAGCAVQRWIVW